MEPPHEKGFTLLHANPSCASSSNWPPRNTLSRTSGYCLTIIPFPGPRETGGVGGLGVWLLIGGGEGVGEEWGRGGEVVWRGEGGMERGGMERGGGGEGRDREGRNGEGTGGEGWWWREEGKNMREGGGAVPVSRAIGETRKIPDTLLPP